MSRRIAARCIGVLGMSLLASCADSDRGTTQVIVTHSLLRVEQSVDSASTVVRLIPAAGAQLNARLAPALELQDTVLYFGGALLTADSAYFVEPPTLQLPRGATAISGTLRASVCPAAQNVCVIVELPIRTRL